MWQNGEMDPCDVGLLKDLTYGPICSSIKTVNMRRGPMDGCGCAIPQQGQER